MTLLTKKKKAADIAAETDKPDRPKWFAQIRWNHQNREARRAHALVAAALKTGKLKRGKCWCGSLRTEAHHPDYSEPLRVDWLCRKHHRGVHDAERRDAKAADLILSEAA